MLERLGNRLAERNTDLRTEVIGGVTTFATMAYIAVVNPAILSAAMGAEWAGALMVATCLSAAIATALMGWFADYPIALAPGMGLNAYFAYSVVIGSGLPWEVGLAAVFISGVLFVILAAVNVQEMLVNAIPTSIRYGTAAGIGIFIAFIGLQHAGIVQDNPATLVSLGSYASRSVVLSICGIVLIGALMLWRVRGAIIIGIVAVALVGAAVDFIAPPEQAQAAQTEAVAEETPAADAVPPVAPAPPQERSFLDLVGTALVNLPAALNVGLLTIIITFLFVDLFDTAGTLSGVSGAAGLLDENGRLPKARRAFLADGLGTSLGAIMGTSTVTSYIESASGIAEGARTGIANYVTALLFLLAIPFASVVTAIPGYATAPALVVVGVLMCSQMSRVQWGDMAEGLPAMAVMIGIPLTFSIADGLSLAFLIHPLLLGIGGRAKEVHWLGWLLAGLVLVRYAAMAIVA